MQPETFAASRWTAGNLIFPTRLVVTELTVMRRKRSWLTVNEESVSIGKIATVNITTGILWSDIRIESTGGSDPLVSHGHTKSDARRVKTLIETLQSHRDGPMKVCPFCAESIKEAARVCRYCGRELP